MPDSLANLRAQQLAFAHHVRDPGTNPPPGIEERRLRVYRSLFLDSMGGLLAGNFPVIRRTLPDAAWQGLVREFYAGHRCTTPLFTEVGGEFVEWLATRDPPAGPPWLPELAHYEWIELALQVSDAETAAPCGSRHAGEAFREGLRRHGGSHDLRLSPLARPLAYAWPVHRIGPDWQPLEPPATPTLLLVRRDAAGDVGFSELSPLVFRLLQLLETSEPPWTAERLLATLAGEAGERGNAAFLEAGNAMLERLLDEGTVLRALC